MATEPEWPRTVYVPRNASVFINCNTNSSNSFWAIDLAGDDFNVFLPFATSREYLNDHGVYELERPGMLSALRLLINNTEINNQTMIRCYGGTKLHQTTLYLYSKLYHHNSRAISI